LQTQRQPGASVDERVPRRSEDPDEEHEKHCSRVDADDPGAESPLDRGEGSQGREREEEERPDRDRALVVVVHVRE